MNKNIKKLALLSTVFALTSCGGGDKINWEETTKENFVEKLSFAHARMCEESGSIKSRLIFNVDHYEDVFGYETADEKYTYTFDIDMPGMKMKYSYKGEEKYALVTESFDGTNSVYVTENDEYLNQDTVLVSYVAGVGVVEFRESSKTYAVLINDDTIQFYLDEETTLQTIMNSTFAGIFGGFTHISLDGSDLADYLTETAEYRYGGNVSKCEEQFSIAEDKSFKYALDINGDYDEGGYAVDYKGKEEIEINNFKLKYFYDEYRELGKYSISEYKKVDYQYKSIIELKTEAFVKFNAPNIGDYTKTTAL